MENTSTDRKALCAELLRIADDYHPDRNEDCPLALSQMREAVSELAERLSALPEPEGPTDEELTLTYAYAVAVAVDNKRGPVDKEDVEAAQLAGLRAVIAADRARWGRPAVEAGLKESAKYDEDHWRKDALEKLIYAAMCFRLGVYSAEELEIFEKRGRAVLANWGQAHD